MSKLFSIIYAGHRIVRPVPDSRLKSCVLKSRKHCVCNRRGTRATQIAYVFLLAFQSLLLLVPLESKMELKGGAFC
jgi:hypothetical protein